MIPDDYVFVCKKCGDEIGIKYEPPTQEPVGVVCEFEGIMVGTLFEPLPDGTPLYTAPKQLSDEIEALKHDNQELLKSLTAERTPKQLSDEEITDIAMHCSDMNEYGHSKLDEMAFARALLKKASEK